MMVRVGADFSSLISQSKTAATATQSWANATSSSFAKVSSSSGGVSSLSNALSGIRGVIGKVAGAAGLAGLVKSSIDTASDLAEVQNVVDVAFGSMSDAVGEWSRNAITQFGMSELSAKQTASTYMAMASAMGAPQEAAADMSLALAGLSADVASFFNLDQDTASYKLRSVFTGETEALKDLGIVMTQTNLSAYAMANGFGTAYNQMSASQQMMVRYGYVMDALSLAQGDFARTSDSWANQVRILKNQFQALTAVLGKGFIAVLTPVVKTLNAILATLVDFANAVSSVFSDLFGSKKTELTPSFADVDTSGIDGYSDAVDDLASSESGAASAAKELQRQVLGFDQITKLTKNTSSSSSGGGGGGGSGGGGLGVTGNITSAAGSMLDSVTEKTNVFTERMQQFRDFLAGLDFTPLQLAWDHLRDAAGNLGDVLSGALSWALTNVLEPLSKWTIEEAAPTLMDALASATQFLADALVAVQPAWQWLWDNMISPLASTVGENILNPIKALGSFFDGLDAIAKGDWRQAMEEFRTSWDYLCGGQDLVDKRLEVQEYRNGKKEDHAMNSIHEMWHSLTSGKAEMAIQLVQNGWTTVKGWVEAHKGEIISALVGLAQNKWATVGGWASNFIGSAVNVLVGLTRNNWSSVSGWVSDFLGGAVSKAVGLSKSWSSVASWVSSYLGGNVNKGIGLQKSGWSSVTAWIGRIPAVSAGVKLVKSGWTSLSRFIGSFTKSIGLKLSWKTSGLSALQKTVSKVLFGSAKWPTLKFAARGGIVDRATLLGGNLVAGEAGKEAIIPLENHTEWIDKVADRVAQRLSTNAHGDTNSRPIVVQVMLDGRVVGQSVVDYAIGVATTTGQLPWAAYT